MSNDIPPLSTAIAATASNSASRPDRNDATWSDAVSAAMARHDTNKTPIPQTGPQAGKPNSYRSDPLHMAPNSEAQRGEAQSPQLHTSVLSSASSGAGRLTATSTAALRNDTTPPQASPHPLGRQSQPPSLHSPVPPRTPEPTRQTGKSRPTEQSAATTKRTEHTTEASPLPHQKPDVKTSNLPTTHSIGPSEQSLKIKSSDRAIAQPAVSQPQGVVTQANDLTTYAPLSLAANGRAATEGSSAISATGRVSARPGQIHSDQTRSNISDHLIFNSRSDQRDRATGLIGGAGPNPLQPIQGGIGITTASTGKALEFAPATPSQAGLANAVQELTATGGGTARVSLSPASLGHVIIDVLVSATGQVSISMKAESERGQQALTDSISGLTRHMSQTGFSLGTVQIIPKIQEGSNASSNSNAPGQGGNTGQHSGQMPGGSQQGSQYRGFSESSARSNIGVAEGKTEITGPTSGPKRLDDGVSAYA